MSSLSLSLFQKVKSAQCIYTTNHSWAPWVLNTNVPEQESATGIGWAWKTNNPPLYTLVSFQNLYALAIELRVFTYFTRRIVSHK